MDVDGDEGWTVVRGNGKGKSKGKGKGTSLKRARDECCPGEGGACTAPSAAAGADGTMPVAPVPGHTGRTYSPKSKRVFRERTAEEQCEQLVSSVLACRAEVAGSPFFARLQRVLAEAAAHHLGHHPQGAPPQGGPQQGGPQGGPQAADPQGGSGAEGGRDQLAAMEADGVGQRQWLRARDGARAAAATATATGPAAAAVGQEAAACPSGGGGGTGDAAGGAGGGSREGDEGDADMGEAAAKGGGGKAAAGQSGWRCMRSLVVYGLGSPHCSRVSRYQLALVLLLRDQVLCGLSSPVQLYDPAFDEVDRLALQQMGLQITEVNEGAARRVSEPTFFYMPHCEVALYDALLRANWSGGALSGGGGGLAHLAVLGNSFRQYLERWEVAPAAGGSGRKACLAGPVVRCCQEGAVVELPTPDLRFHAQSAFNSMALHLFPPSERLGLMLRSAEAEEAAAAAAGDSAAKMETVG